MNNRLYLVTGAAGFLGSTICRQLVERGDKVRAFVLPNDKSVKYLPIGIANCLAKFMEMIAKKTGKQPLMTTFSVYNLDRNNAFDSTKAREELGYTTRSYRETIRDEIAWLKQEGKIAA